MHYGFAALQFICGFSLHCPRGPLFVTESPLIPTLITPPAGSDPGDFWA